MSGADWFMLAFDRSMQRVSGQGNVCHLTLSLDGTLSLVDLQARLDADPAWAWLASLRADKGAVGEVPCWVTSAVDPQRVREHHVDREADIVARVFDHERNAFLQDPVAVSLVQVAGAGSVVVLSWHHALMDARGGELWASWVAGVLPSAPTWVVQGQAPEGTPWERLMLAKKARDFLFRTGLGRIATVSSRRIPRGGDLAYRRIVLTAAETARVDARAKEAGASLVRSAFVLVGVARAVRAMARARGHRPADVLVPVPQDQRKRGATGPVITNRIGVLFYRLPDALLDDTQASVASVLEQLKAILRQGIGPAYGVLLDMCRHLPLPFYFGLVRAPTMGRIATFGFSDTGASLSRIDRFASVPVREAAHFPANIHPPGFTVVATRYGDALHLCVSFFRGMVSDAEYDAFELHLRRDLVGSDDEAA